MLVEAATARWLLARVPPSLGRLIPGIGVVLLALIWGSTAFLQVPAHRQLERAFAELVHRRLVRTNWIRTSLWTARSVLALRMLLLAP